MEGSHTITLLCDVGKVLSDWYNGKNEIYSFRRGTACPAATQEISARRKHPDQACWLSDTKASLMHVFARSSNQLIVTNTRVLELTMASYCGRRWYCLLTLEFVIAG